MDLERALVKALRKRSSGLSAPRFELRKNERGGVGGFVISRTFARMPQLKRQDLVWSFLEREMRPADLRRIVALVTVTPKEAGPIGQSVPGGHIRRTSHAANARRLVG